MNRLYILVFQRNVHFVCHTPVRLALDPFRGHTQLYHGAVLPPVQARGNVSSIIRFSLLLYTVQSRWASVMWILFYSRSLSLSKFKAVFNGVQKLGLSDGT